MFVGGSTFLGVVLDVVKTDSFTRRLDVSFVLWAREVTELSRKKVDEATRNPSRGGPPTQSRTVSNLDSHLSFVV